MRGAACESGPATLHSQPPRAFPKIQAKRAQTSRGHGLAILAGGPLSPSSIAGQTSAMIAP
jgi:hypothetical protein